MRGAPSFFDVGVQRAYNFSQRITLCVGLACLFRAIFDIHLLEIAVFTPLIGYTEVRLMEWVEEKRRHDGVRLLLENKKGHAIE